MAKKTGLKEAKKVNKLKVGSTLLKVVGVTVGAGVALIAGTNKIMSELTKEEDEKEQEIEEDKLEKEDEEDAK